MEKIVKSFIMPLDENIEIKEYIKNISICKSFISL